MSGTLKSISNRLSSIDSFSPVVFFPAALFLFSLLGNLTDQGRSSIFNLKYSTYPLFIVATVVYYLVYYFVKKRNIMLPSISVPWFSKLFFIGISVLSVIGALSLGYLFATGQLGILSEEIRRHINPKLNFLSAFFWFGYLILMTEFLAKGKMSKKKSFIILGISSVIVMGLVLLLGYRTNPFMILFTLLIFLHYNYKKLDFRWLLLILVVVIVAFSFFGNMRVQHEDKNSAFNKNPIANVQLDNQTKTEIKKINEMPKWYKVITAEFVNDKVVLSRIIQSKNERGAMHGKLAFSAIKTILPGQNESPRTIVTDRVNHLSGNGIPVTRDGRTTTPTLLGQLFLDGGYVLLIIGIAVISLLLTSLYNRVKSSNQSNYKIAYAFLTALMFMCIHTGLLDVIFYIFFIGMIIYALIKKENNEIKKEVN